MSRQTDELREVADRLWEHGKHGVNAVPLMLDASVIMREAAKTIESLRKQIAKCQIAELKADYDTSRYFELFGTPERAARTSWYMLMCKYVDCHECPIADGCDIATDIDCEDDEAALLEWLTLEWIEEPDAIRNELTDSGLIDTRAELRSDAE